ncbi:Slam-dependent surface lipoprotein [Vibrio nereis]|uniref:Slam-dependent surface lipoprotein n=1 Tax=Vibrio nereis TaxID=693 RepID=UPI00249580C9|nr:Slam-dependent surface lipoprotein [Vibrio nereis]
MKIVQLSWISAAMLGLSSLAHAGFDGGISNGEQRQVGESEVWVPFVHSKGKAGIGSTGGKKVDFEGLTTFASQNGDVYTSGSDHNNSKYVFSQVAGQDIWFGEWSSGSENGQAVDRAVYYVGDDTGTTVPTSGSATYTVAGINNGNALNGTFNADFAAQTLSGSIANANLKVELVNNSIDSATAQFSGSAVANDIELGHSQGHFFGAEAAFLAGFAQFEGNSSLDTAFGGSKD